MYAFKLWVISFPGSSLSEENSPMPYQVQKPGALGSCSLENQDLGTRRFLIVSETHSAPLVTDLKSLRLGLRGERWAW